MRLRVADWVAVRPHLDTPRHLTSSMRQLWQPVVAIVAIVASLPEAPVASSHPGYLFRPATFSWNALIAPYMPSLCLEVEWGRVTDPPPTKCKRVVLCSNLRIESQYHRRGRLVVVHIS